MSTEINHLAETLNQLMETEGVSAEKLSRDTNIPLRFISAMEEGVMDKLPAEPYVRGYLAKIAPILKTEPTVLIEAYKVSMRSAKLKAADRLPKNAYAKAPFKKNRLIALIIVVAIAITLFWRFNAIIGIPELTINIPDKVSAEQLNVSGSVHPGDRVSLNGEILFTDEFGRFEKDMFLSPGLNTFDFKIRRFLGRETEIVKQVYYEAPAPSAPVDSTIKTVSPPAAGR